MLLVDRLLACNDDINLNATSDDQDRGSCNSEKTEVSMAKSKNKQSIRWLKPSFAGKKPYRTREEDLKVCSKRF